MVEIVPTILASSKQEFEEKLSKIPSLMERIQVDIVDGVFAENKTVDLTEINRSNFSGKVDVQLMVEEPINWIGKAVKFGADCLIGHIRMMKSQVEFVRQVKEEGMKVGLGLDLGMSGKEIEASLWGQLEAVLVMSVKTGFSGQVFQEDALGVVREIKGIGEKLNLNFDIIIDGGINLLNAKDVVQAGANVLAVGKAIWGAEDIKNKISQFNAILNRIT